MLDADLRKPHKLVQLLVCLSVLGSTVYVLGSCMQFQRWHACSTDQLMYVCLGYV